MLDHIGVTVSDIAAARRFYDRALAPLGISVLMEITPEQSGGYHGLGYGREPKPFFWLSQGPAPSSGVHVALVAATRAEVDAFHAAALAVGGRDNGAPGLRPHYHPTYYGAFVFDPDGINLEAVCHAPE